MIPAVVLVAGLSLCSGPADPRGREADLAHLAELLHDRSDPRGQSQAALMLVQTPGPAAEQVVRDGLRQAENEEAFHALAAAVRLNADRRFREELLDALASGRARVRQAAAETLAVLADAALVRRLRDMAKDTRLDVRVRQTALWTLGRSGRQEAAGELVALLRLDGDELRRIAALALTELTGQGHGADAVRWQAWWARHKDMTREQWLHMRLTYQTSRAVRLEGDLMRSRAQVLRLHQQLYSRLPVADRLGHLQTLPDQDDPGVRALAVVWSVELLPAVEEARRTTLARLLLRLTHDGSPEVQRAAVLALGRVADAAAAERLAALLRGGTDATRAAAVRALAQQARGATPQARARQKEVIPLLQKALDDRALEVVVEAAEALGTLGAPEAGPVLTGLLRHPSEHVRRTAAQALERMADPSLLDGLLRGLDDPSVTVRFSLVGALGRAAASGAGLTADARKKLLVRLERLLEKDADAGVRGRAATVLGECADAAFLPVLWRQAQAGEERVREKAWDAFVEIVVRSASVELLCRWDRSLTEAKQPSRRAQLLARVYARWDQRADLRDNATKALEALVQAQLEAGKWSSAAPLVQSLLGRTADGGEAARTRCLRWLARAAELAVQEGNKAEALRIVRDARAYLSKSDQLADEFDRLERLAKRP